MSVDTPTPTAAPPDHEIEPGRYLTDGQRLYRLLPPADQPRGPRIALEDCGSLSIVLLDPDDAERLESVTR